MTLRPPPLAALALGLLLPCLGGCARTSGPRPSLAATTSCRAEVDRVYAAQNRGDLTARDTRDTPFSTTFVRGDTPRGLASEYGRDNAYSSCLANAASPPAAGAAAPVGSAGPGATTGPAFSPANRP